MECGRGRRGRAFDYVIPGHGTDRVSTLRLWKAGAPAQIDLNAFNSGDYARAAEFKNRFENISWVLYPNDSTPAGRELRLRQEYFFVAASLQDILFHHIEEHGPSTTSPIRSPFTSTTRTRRSASPN
jgi:starch phosphorylase